MQAHFEPETANFWIPALASEEVPLCAGMTDTEGNGICECVS